MSSSIPSNPQTLNTYQYSNQFNLSLNLKITTLVAGILTSMAGFYLSFMLGLSTGGMVVSAAGFSLAFIAIWSILNASKKGIRSELTKSEEKTPSLSEGLEVWINEAPENEKINRQEAVRRILSCYSNKSTSLYLNKLGLTTLPPQIGSLSQLQELSFWNNNLSFLPPEIAALSQLQYLNLSENNFYSLPPQIGSLSQLQKLFLSFNNLSFLPPEIAALSQLQELFLSYNNVYSLPPEIAALSQLQQLFLSENNLSSLPPEIAALSQLQCLHLEQNNLSSLPPEIGSLSQLQELFLSKNNLSSLPNEILNLSSNCRVDLQGNPFSITVIEQYRQIANRPGYNDPRIYFSMHRPVQKSSLSLDQLFQDLCKIVEKDPIPLIKLKDNDELHSLLSRLVGVANYNQSEIRLALSNLIYNAIETAEKDDDFLNTFKLCILGASTTCGDRVALSLLKLGINLRIKESLENGDLKELIYLLGHGSMALDILEKFATEKIATLKMVDPIEVHLAYPIMLREKLNMPLDVQSMLFFGISGVTEGDLAKAELRVRKLLSDKIHYIEFLIDQDDWKKGLSQHELTRDQYLRIQKKKDTDSEKAESAEDWVRIEREFKKSLYELTEVVLEKNLPPFLDPSRQDELV